jgi:ribonuclease P protein subunit RPR2
MANNSKPIVKKIAAERMSILYGLAIDSLKSNPELSKEYVKNIIKISSHCKIRMDPKIRATICKDCKLPLVPGTNSELRIIAREHRKIYRCVACGRTNSLKF